MRDTNIGIIVYWNKHPWITAHPGGPKRWLSFYIFVMQAFGADTLILVGAPEISHGYHINFEQYDTIEEVLESYEGYEFVSLQAEGAVSLHEFVHPEEKVLYLIGNDYADVPEVPGINIKIENPANSGVLWSHNCAAIVLYDRYLKEMKNGSN